jgi:predicted membrane-bound spermidine synthase
MAALLYLVFVLSGAAGLVYETTWSRYLGLFVGHGAYAQVIVLVIFLGGMSLGAWLVGERSEQLTRPLRWYVAAELLVAIIGVAFHDAFTAVTGLAYDALFPALGAGVLLTVAKWTIAALLILPQSVLLGTTFPLMSAGVLRATRAAPAASGRVLAMLYFTNSLGAAAGGLLAGFWLVELAGLPGTLYAAAALNVIAAGLVAVVGRRAEGEAPVTAGEALDASHANVDAAADATDDAPAAPARLVRALLWVAGGTALASFIYEIAWIRMLALVLGAATHSFELMLSAFILGLALGSLWVRRRADRFADPVQALGRVQVAMGLLAVGTLPLYLQSFHGQAWLLGALGPGPEGYVVFTSAKYAIALAVMLPATFCAGITLPLITRTLLAAGAGERAIGQVYAVNTLGSIAGAALAALVLLPLLGLKGLLVTGALIDAGLGVWLLAGAADAWRPRRAWAPLAAGAALAIAAVATLSRFDRLLLTSGVYRYGMAELAPSWHSVFYADGRTATVSARLDSLTGEVSLATNGKPDASLPRQWMLPVAGAAASIAGDQSAQFLLPLVTLAYHPKARHVATIGHGSGMSSHVLLGSPLLEDLTTIEIEPQMIEGSKAFLPANRRVFEDPRSHFRIDDARSVFAAGGVQYDLILSEPSNPWVSGVSGLFTDEFYQRTRRALAPHPGAVAPPVRDERPARAERARGGAPQLPVVRHPPGVAVRHPDRGEQRAHAAGGRLLGGLAPAHRGGHAARAAAHPRRARGHLARRPRVAGAAARPVARGELGLLPVPRPGRPSMLIGRVEQMAHAAALRAAIVGQLTPQEIERSPQVAGLLFAWRGLDALARANQPPGDWRAWLAKVQDVEDGIDGGLAGSIDSSFYAMIEGYLQRQAAPPPVRTAVGYMKALSSWNWPAAAATSDSLLLLDRRGQRWMGAEILRAGGVVAHLKVGDVPGARRFMDVLTPQLKLALTDVRTLILDSWVREAEGERP